METYTKNNRWYQRLDADDRRQIDAFERANGRRRVEWETTSGVRAYRYVKAEQAEQFAAEQGGEVVHGC